MSESRGNVRWLASSLNLNFLVDELDEVYEKCYRSEMEIVVEVCRFCEAALEYPGRQVSRLSNFGPFWHVFCTVW